MLTFRSMLGIGVGIAFLNLASAEESALLQERHQVGDVYHVSSRSDLSGRLTPPAEVGKPRPQPIDIRGDSIFEYDERILSLDGNGLAQRTARYCQKMSVEREIGEQKQRNQLRDAVRRLVVLREKQKKAPFSPDGPLTWTEIDLIRTDVFVPHLLGLLPQKRVRVGERWNASTAAVLELTGMTEVTQGSLECKFLDIATMNRRQQAHVQLTGTLKGINEDGPLEQQIEGYFLFDLADSYLAYLYIRGTHILLDKDGKEMGKVSGRFVINRTQTPQSDGLSEASLQGAGLLPNDENTMLLYDNAETGLRFVYPRRWRIGSEEGRQLSVETSDGIGILITLEPLDRTPTAREYLSESHSFLRQQKATIHNVRHPKRLSTSPLLEEFSMDVQIKNEPTLMQYYLTRQQFGGALLAARLPYLASKSLRKEVEDLARSVRVTRSLRSRVGE